MQKTVRSSNTIKSKPQVCDTATKRRVKATVRSHGAGACALCKPDELIGAITEDEAVTSCPVLKLFTGQMAGNNVTRLLTVWEMCPSL